MAVYRLEKDVGSKDEDNLPLLTSLRMALGDYRVRPVSSLPRCEPAFRLLSPCSLAALPTRPHHHCQDDCRRGHTVLPYRGRDLRILQDHHAPPHGTALPRHDCPLNRHLAHVRPETRAVLALGHPARSRHDRLHHFGRDDQDGASILLPLLDARRSLWLLQRRARLDLVVLPSSAGQARFCVRHHQLARQHRSDLESVLSGIVVVGREKEKFFLRGALFT